MPYVSRKTAIVGLIGVVLVVVAAVALTAAGPVTHTTPPSQHATQPSSQRTTTTVATSNPSVPSTTPALLSLKPSRLGGSTVHLHVQQLAVLPSLPGAASYSLRFTPAGVVAPARLRTSPSATTYEPAIVGLKAGVTHVTLTAPGRAAVDFVVNVTP